MSDKRLLVTGATGATGRETVRLLREKDYAVRALVHCEDQRANALRQLGAEVVIADLLDFESVRKTLEGIHRAYFIYPIAPGILEATAYFAQSAKEVGLEAIVNMSQISARREAKSHSAQDHWLAERVFDWSGIPVTHLRPTLFAEWVLYQAAQIRNGILRLPFGNGRHAPVAADDQARVIANILVAPEAHEGKIYPLYGPEEFTFAEMTQEVGRVLGRPIAYQYIDTKALEQMSNANGRNLGTFFWQHLDEIVVDHQNGVFAGTNDLIETVGGKPPMALSQFISKHRLLLTPDFE